MKTRVTNYTFLFIFIWVLIQSCSGPNAPSEIVQENSSSPSVSFFDDFYFVDSTSLGKDRGLIITLKHHQEPKEDLLQLKVFRRNAGELELVQAFDSLECSYGGRLFFEHLNADAYLDLKIAYGSGARGSNVFYHLFVQDTNRWLFKPIRNSKEKANLEYDADRNLITSVAYWAGTTFLDYSLLDDSLIAKQGVNVYMKPPNQTVREYFRYDENGLEYVYLIDSVADNGESVFSRELDESKTTK